MRHTRWLVVVIPPVLLLSAVCFRVIQAQGTSQFGDPLPGLPESLRSAFQSGRQKFTAVETPATGLGPVFNGRSCVECHSNPAVGGSGGSLDNRVVRFARRVEGQPLDFLQSLGGPHLQRFGVGGELPGCAQGGEMVPPGANLVGLRQPPPLFGLGLMQAIPDSAILANADPADADGDGVAGRANISNGVIGRFGWKAAVPNILEFVGLAMLSELGMTNFAFLNEMSPQGGPIPPGCDVAADPEDDGSRLGGLFLFTFLLGPPPRGPITDAVLRGEALFQQVGCAGCHVPSLRTGPHALEALNQKEVPLFSDLLTHYMGGRLDDGIPEGAVGGGRWRTAPLWGLRARMFFLHDGRTSDLTESIRLHGGEGSTSRARFFALPRNQRDDLIAFLRSL